MFVLFALIAITCAEAAVLVWCQFIKHMYCKYVVCVVAALIIVASSTVFVIDLVSYLKGDITTTGHIAISQTKATENLDFFTVNDTYWSIGGNFQKHRVITAIKPKDMEIKVIPTDNISEQYEFTIYYLPVSKFITKIEVSMTDGDLDVSNYDFFKSGYYIYENKITSYIAMLSSLALIGTIILTILKKQNNIDVL